jgi:2-keto-4-pentenoate hydratase/2-oxohepta-3-ene-1,7-dioic acid hydratase in catechol pathway
MRLVQYRTKDGNRVGVVVGGDLIVNVQKAAVRAGQNAETFRCVTTLLRAGRAALEFVRNLPADSEAIPLASVELDAPVTPGKIVAIGLNYRDHAIEAGLKIPAAPLCFAKFTSSLAGPYDPIQLPSEDAQVDFEGELGVVIGRAAKRVAESEAMNYVAGYVTFNDVSERKWQFDDGQWTRGKSCDSFAPFGPCLVTGEEVPDPGALRIETRVNGEVLQSSNTNQLIFGIPSLISYLSHSFTLDPGDLIATGTPSGVGFTRKPPRFLKEGDQVEVEIEMVGKICNRVIRSY